MQLLFIRKEIERKTVRDSELLTGAVQVAVNNSFNKRKARLWKRRSAHEGPQISDFEIEAIRKRMEKDTPWTPWQGKGGASDG